MSEVSKDLILLGRISGLYGVRGWVKVYSYTEPRENILGFSPWHVRLGGEWQFREVAEGRVHGKGIVARLSDVEDRDAAAALVGADIAISRDRLPAPAPGEYYWTDLIGLRVFTLAGAELGVVDHLLETGANDVLVVQGERERLIPFIREQVVVEIDLERGVMRVDWDPDF